MNVLKRKIIFITPSHKPEILEKYLLKSKIFNNYELIVQKDYKNVSKAYNDVTASADIFIYAHHDVFLPDDFEINLLKSLDKIDEIDPHWAVLGVFGVILNPLGKVTTHGRLLDRGKHRAGIGSLPHEVDTLDELILITHGDFRFDENIPAAHFYGADICLQAKLQGRKNYAIDAYLHHNSQLKVGERPDDFGVARDYMKHKYQEFLPIATTCTIINRS